MFNDRRVAGSEKYNQSKTMFTRVVCLFFKDSLFIMFI